MTEPTFRLLCCLIVTTIIPPNTTTIITMLMVMLSLWLKVLNVTTVSLPREFP